MKTQMTREFHVKGNVVCVLGSVFFPFHSDVDQFAFAEPLPQASDADLERA